MKEFIKQVFIGIVVLVIAMSIFYFIYDPSFSGKIRSSLTFGGEDILDVVKNPEKYEGKEILLKNSFITISTTPSFTVEKVISAEESDGNFIHLKYNYYRNIYCGGYADLKGSVLNTIKSPGGLISVDDNGNKLEGSYYFNVTEAKCRK